MAKSIKFSRKLSTLEKWNKAAEEKYNRALALATDRLDDRGLLDGLTLGPARRALRAAKTFGGALAGCVVGSVVSETIKTGGDIAARVTKLSGDAEAAQRIARTTKELAKASESTCAAIGAVGFYAVGSIYNPDVVESAVEQGCKIVSDASFKW